MSSERYGLLLLGVAVTFACGQGVAQRDSRTKEQARVSDIEVVAGDRIGAIRLGMNKAELPAGSSVDAATSGEFEGIHFMLERDLVSEIWIPNLRAYAKQLVYRAQPVPRSGPVELLKQTFGPCTRVEGIVGGARYQCTPGIVLGFDFQESGAFVQLRIQPKR